MVSGHKPSLRDYCLSWECWLWKLKLWICWNLEFDGVQKALFLYKKTIFLHLCCYPVTSEVRWDVLGCSVFSGCRRLFCRQPHAAAWPRLEVLTWSEDPGCQQILGISLDESLYASACMLDLNCVSCRIKATVYPGTWVALRSNCVHVTQCFVSICSQQNVLWRKM